MTTNGWQAQTPVSEGEREIPVSVLLAGSPARVEVWKTAFAGDYRFQVSALANDEPDLRSKMATHPEILLLEAQMFPGPPELYEYLMGVEALVYVLLPEAVPPEARTHLENLEAVKGIAVGDVNVQRWLSKMVKEAAIRRDLHGNPQEGVWPAGSPGRRPVGLRIVTVWNLAGGVGKTTVASNLAYEAARRGYPTLLVGLGAPDDLPLILGLKPEPNVLTWWANPTEEGLRLAVQKADTLDVIAGFPDVLSEAQAQATPEEAPHAIPNMLRAAAHYGGYAVVIVDAPPSALAASALTASNGLVLVADPSLANLMRTVEAYRTVTERLAGEHRIPEQAIYLTLNKVGERLEVENWHRSATHLLGRGFPPLVAQIPFVQEVGQAQDQHLLPLMQSDRFARALKPLADQLYQPAPAPTKPAIPRKTLNFGLFKVRV